MKKQTSLELIAGIVKAGVITEKEVNKPIKTNNIMLQALQNFGDQFNMKIVENWTQDKRKTVKKYFATINGTSVSPVLTYDQLNCFLIGWCNAQKQIKL